MLRFDALGARVLVPFRAARVPARVLWCNFELARALGFRVRRDNRLDARLERELVRAFSFRADADANPRGETVTLHADRYFGSGMEDHRGSARGGIHLASNVFVKGLGRTPLAGTGNPRHSNGACHVLQCVTEAVFGEVDARLFTAGATRVLAILDQGQEIVFEGELLHAAVVVRVGVPYRPAHLVRPLGEDLRDLPALFVRLTKLGGHLVSRRGRPDYAATMRRLLALHARTAAEQVRWRVLHGAMSTSNIGLFGEMIDLNSQATQARTAPISVQRIRRTRAMSFLGEHIGRGQELSLFYLSVIESLSPRARAEAFVDCEAELATLYREALAVELLRATGLSCELAEAVARDAPELVRRYRDALSQLMALANPGSRNARTSTCARIGVVDVFRVLAHLPRRHLDAPGEDLRTTVRALANIRVFGDARRRARTRAIAEKKLDLLAELHRAVLEIARRIGGPDCARDICERAEIENRPIYDLERTRLLADASLLGRVEKGSREGLPALVQRFVDERVASSMRNADAMLAEAVVKRRGRLETQRRVARGVEHVLCSRDGRAWWIELRFEPDVVPRFVRFSFDDAKLRVARVSRARARIPVRTRFGVLEAAFPNGERLLPFSFAVPDRRPTRG